MVVLLWRPGQITRVHDRVTWCAFAVIQGVEHHELFDADGNMLGVQREPCRRTAPELDT